MRKALLGTFLIAALFITGAYAATIVTEVHPFSQSYTDRVTVSSRGKQQVVTVTGTVTGAITEQDTYPDPSTVTVTTVQTVTAPPSTTTAPTTTTTPPDPEPPSSGITVLPGQSWQAAADLAAPGSVISVAPGQHGEQGISGTKQIIFRGQEGAVLTRLHFDGQNITVDNVDVDGNGLSNVLVGFNNSYNTLKNAEVRDNKDKFLILIDQLGHHSTLINVWVHDAHLVTDGAHMECIFMSGSYFTLLNSHFSNCAVFDLFITRTSWSVPEQPDLTNIRVENTLFEPSIWPDFATCCSYYSMMAGNTITSYNNYTFKNNTFQQAISINPNGENHPFVNPVLCGNTGPIYAEWKVPCA